MRDISIRNADAVAHCGGNAAQASAQLDQHVWPQRQPGAEKGRSFLGLRLQEGNIGHERLFLG
jgi:hypothetical protein